MTNAGHPAARTRRPTDRATVLDTLRTLTRAAATGPAVCALIRGGGGSGRTTILRAVHDAAREGGANVLRTVGSRAATPGAYSSIHALTAPLGVSLPHPARHSRQSISNRVHRAVGKAAADGPVALLVDDAQLCDEESLRCVDHVLRRGAGLRLLVVLAHHPGEYGPGQPMLRELGTRWAQHAVALPPLGVREVAETVREVLAERPEPAFTVRCAQVSGGSPARLRAVLDAALRRGLRPDARGARQLDALADEALPALAVRDVTRRGGHLPRVARAVALLNGTGVLDLAAVGAAGGDRGVVDRGAGDAAGGRGLADRAAGDAGAGRGVVDRAAGDAGFVPDRASDASAGGMGLSDRTSADRASGTGGMNVAAPASADARGVMNLVDPGPATGTDVLNLDGPRRATGTNVLNLADPRPATGTDVLNLDGPRRATGTGVTNLAAPEPVGVELLGALADTPGAVARDALHVLCEDGVLDATGCRVRMRPAVRAGLLAALPDADLRVLRARAARLLDEAGRPAEAVTDLLPDVPDRPGTYGLLHEAARAAARRGDQRTVSARLDRLARTDIPGIGPDTRLRHRLELEHLLISSSPKTGLRPLRSLLEHGRDPRVLADAAIRFGALTAGTSDGAEAARRLAEVHRTLDSRLPEPEPPAGGTLRTRVAYTRLALALLEPRDDNPALPREPEPTLPPALAAAVLLHLAGRSTEARSLLARSVRTDTAGRDPRAGVLALSVRSLLSHVAGDRGDAERSARAALAVMARTPQAAGLLLPYIAYVQTLAARASTGQAPDAATGPPPAVAGRDDLRETRRSLYEEYLRAVVPLRLGRSRPESPDVPARPHAVRAADLGNPVLTGWRLAAEQAVLTLDANPAADEASWDASATGHRLIGLGLTATARIEADRTGTGAAHAPSDEQGQRAAARAAYRCGSDRLRVGDTATAREQLERAATLADRSGARVLATMAGIELTAAGGPLRHSTDALTPSELRVAGLAAQGATNREIADRLFLACRTVESHLTSVYKKIPGGRAALSRSLPAATLAPRPPSPPERHDRTTR